MERLLESSQVAELVDDPDALRGLVFDVEAAAENLSSVVRREGPGLSERARARYAARAGRLAVAARAGRPVRVDRTAALAMVAREQQPRSDDAPVVARAFGRVETGLADLSSVVVTGHLLEGFAPVAAVPAAKSPDPTPRAGSVQRPGLSLHARTAVQVAVAGALAILAGKSLSPVHWFWAVSASYVVFVNTKYRAATVRRAFGRVAGTVLGVVAGLLLGKAVTGDPHLAVVLIVLLIFAAYWLVSVSYTALVFCFTLTISALYSILGVLSWSLMSLRIKETVVGATIGGLVSVLVLPRRGSDAVSEEIDAMLEATGELLDRMASGDEAMTLRTEVRQVDQAFQTLRATMAPTVAGLPGPTPDNLRRQLLHVASIRYWARTLAIRAPGGLPIEDLASVRSHVEQARRIVRDGATAQLTGDDAPRHDDPVGVALRNLDDAVAALVGERVRP